MNLWIDAILSFGVHLYLLIVWEAKQIDENDEQCHYELDKVLFSLQGEKLTEVVTVTAPLIGTEIDLEETNLDQPKVSESLSESAQKEVELEQLIKKHDVDA